MTYKFDSPTYIYNTLQQDIKRYRDTKSISLDLVQVAKSNEVKLQKTIYRGDSVYPSFLTVNEAFKFHNHISSWTYSKEIALKFANTIAIPDWYFDEEEWYSEEAYPFKSANENLEEIVPVLFQFTGDVIRGIVTSDYIDVVADREYVLIDEEELIVGDIDFYIKGIEQLKDTQILLVTLSLE